MSVSEQERHQLYIAVESAIGTEGAATLMEYLPPTGWADVARKDDVAAVRSDLVALDAKLAERINAQDEKWSERMDALDQRWSERMIAQDERVSALDEKWDNRMAASDARMDALEHRLLSKMDGLRAEFFKSQESQTRLVVFGMITMVVAVAALAFGAARLA